jgi:hypothetical protein
MNADPDKNPTAPPVPPDQPRIVTLSPGVYEYRIVPSARRMESSTRQPESDSARQASQGEHRRRR